MSDLHESNIQELISRVCMANNNAQAYELYCDHFSQLKDYKFVLASQNGTTPGFTTNRTFSAGASVRGLFKTDKVLVLDAKTVKEMETGAAFYHFDYSISLDTQALSYLKPYISGHYPSSIPSDFQEVFEFISNDDVHVDPQPYIQENIQNLSKEKSAEEIYLTLKAYEVLRTLDTTWLKKWGEVRSQLTDYELSLRAQHSISNMYRQLDNKAFVDICNSRHQFMYTLLLKMVILHIKNSQGSVDKKMAMFLEFCDTKMATMSSRHIAIAHAYFRQGQSLSFFGKIQKGNKNWAKHLHAMAWDLIHISQLEQNLTLKLFQGARYFFPALLTFDKGFIDVIDLYPLKACAFKIDTHLPFPFYDGNLCDLASNNQEQRKKILGRYYTDEAKTLRDIRREQAIIKHPEIIKELEVELNSIISA